MFKNLLLVSAMFVSSIALSFSSSKVVRLDEERTVSIVGPVGVNVIATAEQIIRLADKDTKPIYVVINSPGGNVHTGILVIQAIRVAQSRGIKIRCVSTVMAASMGFQILAACDERFVLRHTYLLWHPMRLFTMYPQDADELLYNGNSMKSLEDLLNKDLLSVLQIPTKVFYYHRKHETMWTAEQLKQITPRFIVIVDDVQGIKSMFEMSE
jgi:ATP-dependent protease ClpP protease subunit